MSDNNVLREQSSDPSIVVKQFPTKQPVSLIRQLTCDMAAAGILSDVPCHEYQLQVLLPVLGRINNG